MKETLVTVNQQEELEIAITKAQILLSYSSQEGFVLDDSVVEPLIEARKAIADGKPVPNEKNFWIAYAKLSKAVDPVTVNSLIAVREGAEERDNLLWKLFPKLRPEKEKSIARRSVERYRRQFWITMLAMLAVQIYWVVGLNLVTDSKKIPIQIDALISNMDSLTNVLLKVDPNADITADSKIAEIENDIAELEKSLEARFDMMIKWNAVWQKIPFISANRRKAEADGGKIRAKFQYSLLQAHFALDAVGKYLLPLLYGMLGAYAFVLRRLADEIKKLLYREEANINYSLRLHLGALSGLAIGWFAVPASNAEFVGLDVLSPLALAFLAGYSVELLFTIMDRLIVKEK